MSATRMGRINEEIQRTLSDLIRTVKDPRVHGLISITAVDTTADLKYAKVYVSVLDQSDVNEVIKGLKSASGYLRRELGHALSLRATPELQFVRDDSMEKGAHIINMASQASFQPLPYQNIYSSTKAFVRNYTRALNVELKSKGVVATAVCPGWMQTRLIERAIVKGEKGTRVFPHIVYPEVVAKKAIKDAKKSKDISVYGLYVKTSRIVAKLLPQKCMMGIWLKQQRLTEKN